MHSKPSHFFFFSWAWRHFLVPPSAQTSSLFLCRFFFHSFFLSFFLTQFSSSLVQAWAPPSISLFIPNSLPRFFPPVFSPGFTSRSSSKFLGSALFQSHILKNKLITHRPLMKSCEGSKRQKKTRRKWEIYQESFSTLTLTTSTEGHNCCLVHA